jgi:uncharacterized protein YcbK (DUF882 family)
LATLSKNKNTNQRNIAKISDERSLENYKILESSSRALRRQAVHHSCLAAQQRLQPVGLLTRSNKVSLAGAQAGGKQKN